MIVENKAAESYDSSGSHPPPGSYHLSGIPDRATQEMEMCDNINNYKPDISTDIKSDMESLNPLAGGVLVSQIIKKIRNNLLLVLTLVAVFAGLVLGVTIQQSVKPYSTDMVVVLLKFPGELLLRMLKCVILPLVVASVITGVGTIDAKSCGKIGGVAVAYYLSTTVMAVINGLCLVSIIRPGSGNTDFEYEKEVSVNENTNTLDTIMDLLRGAFPDNIVEATFGTDSTVLTKKTRDDGTEYMERTLKLVSGMNMIGVIVFSIICGVIMSLYPEETAPLMKLVQAINDLTMRLVNLVIWYSPIGIFFLIAGQFAGVEDIGKMVQQLGMYIVTVVGGTAIHFFIVLPTIYFACTRKNPIPYYYNMLPAMATAFGTGSSGATMPVTLRCVEENNHIDKRISRFVVPVGASLNMDGAGIYEAVACLYIAQVTGVSLTFGQVVVTGLTSTLAAIGTAAIPGAQLITLIMVLNAVNLPTDMIPLLLTVDWFIGRFLTMTNVMGDALGCAIVQKMCREELDETDREHEIEVTEG